MRPTPPAGAHSTGANPYSSRLPNRSPHITPRRPRSVDVASDWRSGDGWQDPATDSGRLWAHHRPGLTISRAPHHDGAAVPAHRHVHQHEACRSTGKHPPPAANTVRAAQDTLLLTNQGMVDSNLRAVAEALNASSKYSQTPSGPFGVARSVRARVRGIACTCRGTDTFRLVDEADEAQRHLDKPPPTASRVQPEPGMLLTWPPSWTFIRQREGDPPPAARSPLRA